MKKLLISCLVALLFTGLFAKQPTLPMVSISGNQYYLYEAKKGDSLYGIAVTLGWDQDTIKKYNPNLSSPYSKGDVIYYPVGKEVSSKISEGTTMHKIARNETVYGIAKKYGVSPDAIYELNPGSQYGIKAGETLIIPFSSSFTSNQPTISNETNSITTVTHDPVQNTAEEAGSDDLSPAVIEQQAVDNIQAADNTMDRIKGVIILAEPESNKDMEFLRGFLNGVDHLKNADFKTSLKVINGKDEETEIIRQLDEFEPDIIFTTADKNFPLYLQNYSKDNICYLINVFDTKEEGFKDNQMEVQLLTPSDVMNDEIARYISQLGADSGKFIIAGENEGNDQLLETILKYVDNNIVETIDINDLPEFDTQGISKIIIYGTPSKKNDVKELLKLIRELKISSPVTDFITIGRPSWITLSSDLAEELGDCSALIPSRFYFDSSEYDSREFINDYNYLYGHTPMKSYPVYAASGYDAAIYFLNAMSQTGGNLRYADKKTKVKTLQNSVVLKQNDHEGFYNPVIYIIRYDNFGNAQKIEIGNE